MNADAYKPLVVDLAQRSARSPRRDRERARQRRERAAGGVVQRQPVDHPRGPAPAGLEHDPGRRRGEGAAAGVPDADPGGDAHGRHVRPLAGHPRKRPRRAAHARPHDRPRRLRDLPVPPEPPLDVHPVPRAPDVAVRDVRGHGRPRLQPRQPLPHGPDALGRVRRGRRDRPAREHRPPDGEGRERRGRLPARLEGDRLHDPLDDGLARGGLHPRPLHGRAPRPALPGIRRHDQRRDPRVGLRVADADADALQPPPEARGARAPRTRDGSRPPSRAASTGS